MVGWTLIVISAAYLIYLLRVRVFMVGPPLSNGEWTQLVSFGLLLMLGTANVRMAAMRERNMRMRGPKR